MEISLSKGRVSSKNTVILSLNADDLKKISIDNRSRLVIEKEFKNGLEVVVRDDLHNKSLYCRIEKKSNPFSEYEAYRKLAYQVVKILNDSKESEVFIRSNLKNKLCNKAFIEGMILSSYQFLKYFKDRKKLENSLKKIKIAPEVITEQELRILKNVCEGNFLARDLVNEPLSFLSAVQLSKEITKASKSAGFKHTVFNKKKIASLRMGGLLAVNKGSQDPPTFNILEWKPAKKKNSKPIILVGKGVVYDTGGLSLKPTANSMDKMKSDMAGAAAVIGTMYSIAKSKIPVHVIGLIPATDNRPGENAYVPGDVIQMYDKTTVEVLNTDAEGRLILADALSYAKKYKPELVIDLATLTGAAARAVGPHGIAGMGTAPEKQKNTLIESGHITYERIVEFPLWEEFGEMLNSDIADLKNIGGAFAGAITAGKFLQHFTDYPWIHLDIAGTAFVSTNQSYKGQNATGSGVRLLFEFINNHFTT